MFDVMQTVGFFPTPIQCLLQLCGGEFDQLTVEKVDIEQCQSARGLGRVMLC